MHPLEEFLLTFYSIVYFPSHRSSNRYKKFQASKSLAGRTEAEMRAVLGTGKRNIDKDDNDDPSRKKKRSK